MVPVGTMSLLYGTYRYQQAGPSENVEFRWQRPGHPGKTGVPSVGLRAEGPNTLPRDRCGDAVDSGTASLTGMGRLFGLACLLSLRRERPLMFFVSRQFTAGDDETCAQAWDCTASERRISSIDAALDARLGPGRPGRGDARDCRSLPVARRQCAVVEPMLGIGTVAALLTWTTAYARLQAPAAQPSAPDRLTSTHIGART